MIDIVPSHSNSSAPDTQTEKENSQHFVAPDITRHNDKNCRQCQTCKKQHRLSSNHCVRLCGEVSAETPSQTGAIKIKQLHRRPHPNQSKPLVDKVANSTPGKFQIWCTRFVFWVIQTCRWDGLQSWVIESQDQFENYEEAVLFRNWTRKRFSLTLTPCVEYFSHCRCRQNVFLPQRISCLARSVRDNPLTQVRDGRHDTILKQWICLSHWSHQ